MKRIQILLEPQEYDLLIAYMIEMKQTSISPFVRNLLIEICYNRLKKPEEQKVLEALETLKTFVKNN